VSESLSPNTTIAQYAIVSKIGEGGMGEVSRARDTRLGRDVAMKVLPASFANDPDRLQRLEQEARATSALNHPNILTVHDLCTHEGAPVRRGEAACPGEQQVISPESERPDRSIVITYPLDALDTTSAHARCWRLARTPFLSSGLCSNHVVLDDAGQHRRSRMHLRPW
jgi:serine/threonine protein kinase